MRRGGGTLRLTGRSGLGRGGEGRWTDGALPGGCLPAEPRHLALQARHLRVQAAHDAAHAHATATTSCAELVSTVRAVRCRLARSKCVLMRAPQVQKMLVASPS